MTQAINIIFIIFESSKLKMGPLLFCQNNTIPYAKYELDDRPIEEGCNCPACRSYSRAYIRHLLKAKEMLGMRLCVLHNLYFYNTMMEDVYKRQVEEYLEGKGFSVQYDDQKMNFVV